MPIKRSPRKRPRRSGAVRGRTKRTERVAVVNSLAEARLALAAGAGPVVLVSPPGAAAFMGVGFFWALAEAARAEFPGIAIEAVMDCGDDPGWALSALRMGFKAVVLRGDPRARARVAAIARAAGAQLLRQGPRSGTGERGDGRKKGG